MAIRHWFRRWLRQEDGVSTVLLGLMIIPLIGFVGLAVDGGYLYMVHSRLSYATDAAALAGGKVFRPDPNDDEVDTTTKNDVQAYLDANFPNGMFGATVQTPDVTKSADNSQLKVDTAAVVPTLFMQIFGFRTVRLTASSTVEPQGGLEVVLVLDVTGSMGNGRGSKLASMQDGAKALLDTIFKDAAPDAIYAGIVPFRASVNIGNSHKSWIQSSFSWSKFPSSDPWMGCVEARDVSKTGGDGLSLDLSSQTPSQDKYKFVPYLYQNTAGMGPSGNGSVPYNYTTTDWRGRKTNHKGTYYFDNNWPKTKSGTYNPSGSYGTATDAVGPNLGCPQQPIIPLTNDESKLEDAIDSFTTVSRGGTQVSEGLAWGWRVISDAWQSYWGTSISDRNRAKAIVLLTDGNNEVVDYSSGDTGLPGSPVDSDDSSNYAKYKNNTDYTAYGRLRTLNSDGTAQSTGPLGATSSSDFTDKLNDREKSLCDRLKNGADNVTIYTIGYQVTDSTALDNLKNCANDDPDRYYINVTQSTIVDAFKDIGKKLTQLRIVK